MWYHGVGYRSNRLTSYFALRKVVLLCSFLDFAGAEAAGADAHSFWCAVYNYLNALDIGLCGPFCLDIGMAYEVAGHCALTADFTFI